MPRIPSGVTALFGAIGVLLLSVSTTSQIRRDGNLDVELVNRREAVAREVLVKLRESRQPAQLGRIVPGLDPESVADVGGAGILRLRSRSLSATALVAVLANRTDVEYAEPNFVVRALTEPNDPMFPQLWGLKNVGQAVNGGAAGLAGSDIRVTESWDITLGSTANVVAVIDTGIDYTHPDLASNIWSAPAQFTVTIGGVSITCPAGTHGFNAIQNTCDPMDDHNHGTHVSGTIGAVGQNGTGVVGINWTTQLIGLKFLNSSGSGSVADAIKAIEFAIKVKQAFAASSGANIRVLSNSWSGGDFSQALLDQINAANNQDMLFVAAASNSGISNDIVPTFPSSFDAPNVIAVAATTNTDGRASFSNYGASSVDLGAPGVDILSTIRGNAYAFSSGTSMATPHVSGAAALVLSRCVLNTAQLKEDLLGSVDQISSLAAKTTTGGRLNVNSALRACLAPPATPVNVTAIGGDTQVRLSWSAVIGTTGYRVKRSLTPGGPYALVASNVKGAPYTDSGLVNGTTYYYVVTAVNLLGESPNSNEASATAKIPADLVVSSFTVPGTAGAGTTIVVSVTTRNQGTGTADPSTTRVYLSENTIVPEPGDILLNGTQSVQALGAGVSASASVSFGIPAGQAPGQYYIVAKADADDVLLESQEANNTRARFLLVGPDLIVSVLNVPTTATPGATMVLSDTVSNQGGGSAVASSARFYLSANSTLDTGDTLLGSRDVAALAPGVTSSGQATLTIPTGLAIGTYYVIGEADGTKVVAETQETNNTASRAVQIGADLVVSALTVPAKGGAGVVLNVSDTTLNQGSDAVPGTATRFYLSTNSQWDASDTLLADSRTVPALGPGASSTGSTMVMIPSNTAPGTYYVIAKADADNTVAETQEGNNTLSRSIQIGSDFVLSALTGPSKIGAGGSFVFSDTTTNQGGGDAGASVTQFYLSTDALFGAGDTLLDGNRPVSALAAGAASSGLTAVAIPSGTAPGSYYLFGKADGGNAVTETQETNNTAIKFVTLGPDLIVSSVFATSPVTAGLQTTITDTVTNQGGGDAAPSTTRFYLSANFSLDAGDVLLAESRAVPALAAGAASADSTQVTIPAGTTPGTYYIFAKADADGSVAESAETNNAAPRNIQIN